MNIPSAQDVPVFIAFTSVVLSTKETEASSWIVYGIYLVLCLF
uniref:Uncharacterized protein n=1 Tax=Rhodnius prolixus TaxID=13249 RepID=T1IFG4_RHOPR